MPKQLLLSALIDIPADLFDQAEVAVAVKDKWRAFTESLKSANVVFDATAEYQEAKRGAPVKKPRRVPARPQPHTHGSPELDADAAKLEATGADAGPTMPTRWGFRDPLAEDTPAAPEMLS